MKDKPTILALYQEKERDNLTTRQICDKYELVYNTISKKFAEIAKEEMDNAIAKAKRMLAKSAPIAVGQLETLLNSNDERIQGDAAKAILDRTGLSPQAATINIQNVQAGQAVIVPLLAESDAALLQKLAGGE
jgi:hypothetical protein